MYFLLNGFMVCSSGHHVLLPEHTPATSLPALEAVLVAGRIKDVQVRDFPSLLATLHMLKSTISEKHTLLVIHSITPTLMTQEVRGDESSTFRTCL